MLELIPELRVYFDHLQDPLRTFSKFSFQAESWFKGELVTFLDAAAQRKRIISFDREVRLPNRKRVDIRIDTTHGRHWIELKHLMIGVQKGQKWGVKDYFNDAQTMGIVPDVDKLLSNEKPGGMWLLYLCTSNPGSHEWNAGIERFHNKWAPRTLMPMTDPDDFPDCYFLGLLEVTGG